MKKRKFWIMILTFLCVLCFGFACAAPQDEQAEVAFKDFDDKTISVELGDYFSVASYMLVEDEDGNPYHASATIKTADGKAVSHMKYEFKVENASGYVVTLTISRNGDTLATRVLTLSPVDTSSPVVSIGDFPEVCFVGTEYTIPVTVYDANAQTQYASSVFIKGENGAEEEVTVTNGKFTPEKAGTYEVRVAANDGSNPEVVTTKTLKVRTVMPVNALETFEDASSVENLRNDNEYATSGWVAEFEGRTGVAWQTGSWHDIEDTNAYYNFNMTFFRTYAEMSAYLETEWDYISIWLYIDQEYTLEKVHVTDADGNWLQKEDGSWQYKYEPSESNEFVIYSKAEKFNDGAPVYSKQWQEIRLTREMILGNSFFSTNVGNDENDKPIYEGSIETFNTRMNSGCDNPTKANLFYSTQFDRDTKIYIDDVRFIKKVDVTTTSGVTGEEVTILATAQDLECAFDYAVTDPTGNAVTVENGKFTPMMTGDYQVTATIKDHVRAGGVGTGVITVTSDYELQASYPYVSPIVGERVEIPAAQITDGTNLITGDITATVTFNGEPVAVTENGFTVTQAGDYEIMYTAVTNGITLTQKLVITAIAKVPNVVNAFDTEADAANCGKKNANAYNTTQWLSSYAERQGVLKMDGTLYKDNGDLTQYRNFYFDADPNWTKDTLQAYLADTDNWDYLSIWVWIDVVDDEVTVLTIDGSQKVASKTWVELQIQKSVLTDGTGRVGTVEDLSKRLTTSNDYIFYINSNNDTSTEANITVYVDGIYLCHDFAGTLSVAATDGGELTQNSEVTITADITTENALYTFTVIAPDGTQTELGSATSFTPTQAGEYTVTANRRNGWSGAISVTFTVAAAN